MQSMPPFLISLVLTCTCLDYRVLLDLPIHRSGSWKRYTLKGACWCVEAEVRG